MPSGEPEASRMYTGTSKVGPSAVTLPTVTESAATAALATKRHATTTRTRERTNHDQGIPRDNRYYERKRMAMNASVSASTIIPHVESVGAPPACVTVSVPLTSSSLPLATVSVVVPA